jgi:hypothetical protein
MIQLSSRSAWGNVGQMGAVDPLEITVIEPSTRSNVTEKIHSVGKSVAINAKKFLGDFSGHFTMSFL